jgi:effector-binding domain-containing protein
VLSAILPAGRYASLTYKGPYDGLFGANAALMDWAKESGIEWDIVQTPEGERFVCRLEIYKTDPATELPENCETEITIRIADQ